MKKKIRQHTVEEKMDMTPLIDCVFLLIMFFILTTEITMKQAEVELPVALEGKTGDSGLEDIYVRLEVTYDREREAVERGAGKILKDGNPITLEALVGELQKEVDYDKKPPPYGRGRAPEVLPGKGKELSQLKLRIRADRRVKAAYLKTIFTACAQVGIYKIELSSVQPNEG